MFAVLCYEYFRLSLYYYFLKLTLRIVAFDYFVLPTLPLLLQSILQKYNLIQPLTKWHWRAATYFFTRAANAFTVGPVHSMDLGTAVFSFITIQPMDTKRISMIWQRWTECHRNGRIHPLRNTKYLFKCTGQPWRSHRKCNSVFLCSEEKIVKFW